MPDPARFAIRFAINFIRHHLKEFIGEGNPELMKAELGTMDQDQVLKRFADWLEEPQATPQLERVIRQAEDCFQKSEADQALKGGLSKSQLSLEQHPALLQALAGLDDALDEQALRAALVSAFQAYFPQLEKATLEQGAEAYLRCLRQSLLSHKALLPKVVGLAVMRMEQAIERIENSQAAHNQETRADFAEVKAKLQEVAETVSHSKRVWRKPWQAPPLPPHFVPRPEKSQVILEQLVAESHAETPALLISAVHGQGGIGKTTLVSALTQEPRIQERFPDGLLWLTLGQKPDILPGLSGWIQALGDYDFRPTNIESAANHLRTLLSDKACLLVIDDAWQAEPVRLCLVGGKTCRLLITTRDASLARKLGARLIDLDVMTQAQALALFTARLGDLGKQRKAASALAKDLGCLPLAIELAAAQIEGGRGWDELLGIFRARLADLRALELDEASFRNESLRLSFSLSLEVLSEEEQEAFGWLGVLQEDASIGTKTGAILWQIPESAARQRLLRFRDKALLKTLGEERFTIHDLLLDEARLRLQELLPLEQAHLALLQRYQAQCDPVPNALEQKAWHTLPVDGYIHAHLTWHRLEAGQGQVIHMLMREETAGGRHGWYEACERSDLSAVFTNTLAAAWQLAEAERDVPLLVRYALIYASLAALGANIPPELMMLALENGLMSPGRALALIRQMPSSDQPCSSSPSRARRGSADRLVLPVPDRPNSRAMSPWGPSLAEQCRGRMPSPGST